MILTVLMLKVTFFLLKLENIHCQYKQRTRLKINNSTIDVFSPMHCDKVYLVPSNVKWVHHPGQFSIEGTGFTSFITNALDIRMYITC